MKKIYIVIIILIVFVGGILVFGSINKKPGRTNELPIIPTETKSNSNEVSPQSSTSEVSINIINFTFDPATIKIKNGTKVTWINNDKVPHTVTSDSGNLLNSPTLSPGQSFSFVFNGITTENYHCNFHKMMKGTIVVE